MGDDRIDFVLEGQRFQGAWTLTRAGGRAGDDDAQSLLINRTEVVVLRAGGGNSFGALQARKEVLEGLVARTVRNSATPLRRACSTW